MDYLCRAVHRENSFRILAAVTTETVEKARLRHDTWPVATAALGRAMTGCLLLGANLKGDDVITLRIIGDGPLGALVVSANARGQVRGYVQEPHVDLPRAVEGKLPVGAAVGRGTLNVTKDLGLKEPFTGTVELVSGEIASDLASYLTFSEQSPSAVMLGVLVSPDGGVQASGGVWVELLPGAPREVLDSLEKNISVLPPVSSLVARGSTPEDLIKMVAGDNELVFLDSQPVDFVCKCSRHKIKDILVSLGRDEIETIIDEQGQAEVRCHFCGDQYSFGGEELQKLLTEL